MKKRIYTVVGAMLTLLVLLVTPTFAQATHTLDVTLSYDFTVDKGCSATVTTNCLKQFNVYDITGGISVKLFTFPAPSGASTSLTGITATSGALSALASGIHTFVVKAQMADGTESGPNASPATAAVSPSSPASFSVKVN